MTWAAGADDRVWYRTDFGRASSVIITLRDGMRNGVTALEFVMLLRNLSVPGLVLT